MVLFLQQGRIARSLLHGGSWQVEAPLGGGIGRAADDGYGYDFAVGAGDVVHVVTGDSGRVAHLAYNDCAWFMEYVDPDISGGATGVGIALDASNNPYFAYQRRAAGTTTPATYEIWYATPSPDDQLVSSIGFDRQKLNGTGEKLFATTWKWMASSLVGSKGGAPGPR